MVGLWHFDDGEGIASLYNIAVRVNAIVNMLPK